MSGLSLDDIKPGMFAIVTEWKIEDPPRERFIENMWAKVTEPAPLKPTGDPFKVLAVAPPFIVIEICSDKKRFQFDARLADIQPVTRSYVEALFPNYSNQEIARTTSIEDALAAYGLTIEREQLNNGVWERVLREKR